MLFLRLRYTAAVIAGNASSPAREEYLSRLNGVRACRKDLIFNPLHQLIWSAFIERYQRLLHRQLDRAASALAGIVEVPIAALSKALEGILGVALKALGAAIILIAVYIALKIIEFVWRLFF